MTGDEDLIEDRGRGILTQKQREYLMGRLGDEEVEPETIYQRKYRIREHLREALIDFQILAEAYHKVDLGSAIDPGYNEPFQTTDPDEVDKTLGEAIEEDTYEDPELAAGITSLIEVLYRALGKADPTKQSTFRQVLWQGVKIGLEQVCIEEGYSSVIPSHPEAMTFDVRVLNSYHISGVKSAYENDEFLFPLELRHLFWAGEISYEEFQKARRKLKEKEAAGDPDELYKMRERQREQWGLSGPPPVTENLQTDEVEKRSPQDMFDFDDDG